MKKVIITQRRSVINRPKTQKLTMKALGLTRINKSVEKELTPELQGQINKVSHLVEVSEA